MILLKDLIAINVHLTPVRLSDNTDTELITDWLGDDATEKSRNAFLTANGEREVISVGVKAYKGSFSAQCFPMLNITIK